MKNILLSLSLIFCFSSGICAQFGVKAGLNYSTISYKEQGVSINPDSRIGLVVGAVYDINIGSSSTVRAGVQYSGKGFQAEDSDSFFGSLKQTFKSQYIDVPITYNYFVKDTTSGLFLEGGITPGFVLAANTKIEFTEDGETSIEENDVKDDFRPIDVALTFGIGYKIGNQVSIGLNYALGMLNLDDTDSSDEFNVSNRYFSLYAIYHF